MVGYSQIIFLDERLTKNIRMLQKKLFKITGSRACLDMWKPHITIGNCLEVDKDSKNIFYQDLIKITKKFKPFNVEIKNYNFMKNWAGNKLQGYSQYVVYLEVVVNKNLQELAESINKLVSKNFKTLYKQPWPYKPHITIAFKDLNQRGFKKAKEILKEESFKDKTVIDHVAIAIENKKGQHKEYKRFNFTKPENQSEP